MCWSAKGLFSVPCLFSNALLSEMECWKNCTQKDWKTRLNRQPERLILAIWLACSDFLSTFLPHRRSKPWEHGVTPNSHFCALSLWTLPPRPSPNYFLAKEAYACPSTYREGHTLHRWGLCQQKETKKKRKLIDSTVFLRRPKLISSASLSLSAGFPLCVLCATAEVSRGRRRHPAAEIHYWCKSAQVPGSRPASVCGMRESTGDFYGLYKCGEVVLRATTLCVLCHR